MHFNPHTILPIACLIFALCCGVFVLSKNPKAPLNRIFFYICLNITAWFSFYIPFNFNTSESTLLLWFRISYCFISFLPIMCFTFITTYLNAPQNKLWYQVNSSIGIIFCLISLFTPWMVKGVSYYPWHPYPTAGITHPLLIIHCAYLAYFTFKLRLDALKNKTISTKSKSHIKYMSAGILVLGGGALDFIGNYNIPFYSIGYISTAAFLVIVTTAIVKHQLMDIEIVVRKSLVYSILVTLITLIFLTLVLLTEKLSQNYIGYHNLFNSITLSLVIALIFIPLKNKIQSIIDKIFFKGTQEQIAHENAILKEKVLQTEKFKAIANLASGIAHEIKNPLTVLQTFSEHLPQKKDDPEFIKTYQTLVPKEINRINALVQDLLAFAKPSQPQFETINPNQIIKEVISLASLQANNIQIKQNLEEDSTTLKADPNQLKQALLNIIMNAIDAMPNGGTLTIETTLSSPKASVGNPAYTITISDTGHGINAQDLKHIFDPFFTKKHNGTGLGLSITKDIIEKHGGTISAESKLTNGTEIRITLPI